MAVLTCLDYLAIDARDELRQAKKAVKAFFEEAIGRLEGVVAIDAITGPYDAIATLEGESLNKIGDIVTARIHPIAGISRTVTCLAVRSY